MKRLFPAALLALSLFAAAASAQLGPYPLVTKNATNDVTLVKLDKDILWVLRSEPNRAGHQMGIALSDVVFMKFPDPPVFAAVEKLLDLPASAPLPAAQLLRAAQSLDKSLLLLRQFRTVPGVPYYKGLMLKARILYRQEKWLDAVRAFDDIRVNSKDPDVQRAAQIRAGIAFERAGEHNSAVEYLAGLPLPEDDEALLSQLLFALGDAFAALGNYDNALLSYLPLVVFYPYVGDNEARGLVKVLPCYAELKEWEPLYRTIQDIKANFKGSAAEKVADEFVSKYATDLSKAGLFVEGERIVADAEQTHVAGTTIDYSKPEEIDQAPDPLY